MLAGMRFLWRATRGYRLCPWRSPYLRWRIETFTGLDAEKVRLRDFLRFLWQYRQRFAAFLWWCGEMDRWRRLSRHPAQSAKVGPSD